jgi:hypothetical protein
MTGRAAPRQTATGRNQPRGREDEWPLLLLPLLPLLGRLELPPEGRACAPPELLPPPFPRGWLPPEVPLLPGRG